MLLKLLFTFVYFICFTAQFSKGAPAAAEALSGGDMAREPRQYLSNQAPQPQQPFNQGYYPNYPNTSLWSSSYFMSLINQLIQLIQSYPQGYAQTQPALYPTQNPYPYGNRY